MYKTKTITLNQFLKGNYMNSGTANTDLNDMLTDFVEYVDSFYGVNDPLYPMINRETKQPLSKVDIYGATEKYLNQCSDEKLEYVTWGDGDSLDRERVRDILLEEYNYKYVPDTFNMADMQWVNQYA